MDLSIGFVFILIFILFPGLLYRRLYFYGEFSKEFYAGHNLISILAHSSIPGIVIALISYYLYNSTFTNINISGIIDWLKDLNNPNFKLSDKKNVNIDNTIKNDILPFLSFQYILSFSTGALTGRLVRLTKLDTISKLFRFKNFWFYIFRGQAIGFKNYKHLKQKNKKHLFTKADILIDTNNSTSLYSGIVVDYEISDSDSRTLIKVILQKAERYKIIDDKRVKVEIPGTLLVVDCKSMININLTYIYEDTKDLLNSKVPNNIEVSLGLLMIFLIPFFIFKSDSLNFELYNFYFELSFFKKIIVYLFIIQLITLFNPFQKVQNSYKYVSKKIFIAKIIFLIIFFLIICI